MTSDQNQGETTVQRSVPTQSNADEEFGVMLVRLRRENPTAFRLVILAIVLTVAFLCWQGRHQAWGV